MKKNDYNYENSKALFVLKIITMSFVILMCVVGMTALLTYWISGINKVVKDSKTQIAKAAARLTKFKKNRIKHILKLRKLQLKEEKETKKYNKKHGIIDNDSSDLSDSPDLPINDFSIELDNFKIEDM
jgi:hypothetical protein